MRRQRQQPLRSRTRTATFRSRCLIMDGKVILCDTRQHEGKHDNKMGWWARHGVTTRIQKLDFGDYMTEGSNISIDTKRSMAEVAQNCTRDHERFAREMVRAAKLGYRLVILVEAGGQYTCVGDVRKWTNTHCKSCVHKRDKKCNPRELRGKCMRHGTRKPVQGPQLSKIMTTMEQKYGARFEFCNSMHSAKRICDLLGVMYEQDASSGAEASCARIQDTPDKTRN